MTEMLVSRKRVTLVLSEEELAILHMALMKGTNSSNAYFREGCEKLLQKMLEKPLRGNRMHIKIYSK